MPVLLRCAKGLPPALFLRTVFRLTNLIQFLIVELFYTILLVLNYGEAIDTGC